MARLPIRTIIEVLHVLAGLAVALLLGGLSVWSYPRATEDIWLITYIGMACVVLMGVGPVRAAIEVDRARLSASNDG